MENLRQKVYSTLRSSEGFFKTDMVYLAKGNFWQMFGQGVTGIMSLGLLFTFANLLPKETYGLYKYILSIAGILGIFTLTGMNQSVSQAVAQGKEGILRSSTKYQLKWNVLQFASFLILSAYYFTQGNTTLGIAFIILGFVFPINSALTTYSAFLDGKRNFKLNNLFSIASTTMYVAGMLAVIVFSNNIIWIVSAYALTTLISSTIFYFVTTKMFAHTETYDADVIRYGKELSLIGLIGPVVSQIDKIILSHFWGATALAVYAIALAMPERAAGIIKNWASIGLPKFSTKTPQEINQVFYLRILQGMAVGLLCFFAYILVAPYIFKYLIPSYAEGLFYSQLIAISFIFALPNRYISLLLTSQKSSKLLFITQLVNNIIRIGLYLVLGITGGIIGLIIAQVMTNFIGMIINITTWKLHR